MEEKGKIGKMLRWLALGASLAVMVASPLLQTDFPHHPYIPGIVCGFLFTYFAFWGNRNQTRRSCLSRNEWSEFVLTRKNKISPNTAVYRFALASESHGLPIGQHISIGAKIGEKQVVRSYTPISSDDDDLAIGETINVKGPKGNFVYSQNMCKEIGMIAGGTGITPMLQIIKAILKNPRDLTKVSLIFANVSEADILCREELDTLSTDPRFSVYYVLNNKPKSSDFNGGIGFVSKAMIEKQLCSFSNDSKMLLCGPPPMVKAMAAHLKELGWPAPQVVSKLADPVFKF